ncbi:MAG: shikimate kinase [Peptostreptococcaceae bacterium]|nr:shikimate kinase [Peptostreptococcaceae bacterium]
MKISLIGMMGCGKTTLGKLIAKKYNMEFLDIDECIEIKEGKKINEIFKEKSKKYFREIEKKVLKDIIKKDNIVISSGGGIILDQENINILKEHTHVFFINRDIKDIYKDIDINNRPLLKDNKEILFDIYEKRKELYINTAKYNINNKNKKRTLIEIYKIIDIIKE